MIISKTIKEPWREECFDQVQDTGNLDYVKDGEVIKDAPAKFVMVESSSDLELLEGYEPGTVAYTAGYGSMWQLGADGDWVTVGGGDQS